MRTSEGTSYHSFTETARTFPSMVCACREVVSSGNPALPTPAPETEGNLGRWGRNVSAAGQVSCRCGLGWERVARTHLPWWADGHLWQTPQAVQKPNPRSTVFTCCCGAGLWASAEERPLLCSKCPCILLRFQNLGKQNPSSAPPKSRLTRLFQTSTEASAHVGTGAGPGAPDTPPLLRPGSRAMLKNVSYHLRVTVPWPVK